jgi:hypothetical protein
LIIILGKASAENMGCVVGWLVKPVMSQSGLKNEHFSVFKVVLG